MTPTKLRCACILMMSAAVVSGAGRWKLPRTFERNTGQTDAAVSFLLHGRGYTALFMPGEVVLRSNRSTVRMNMVGIDPKTELVGVEPVAMRTNYLLGPSAEYWHTGVPSYGRLEYRNVYPGITLVFYDNGKDLEYDFVVAPGADPGQIRLRFDGVDQIHLATMGELVQRTTEGEYRHRLVSVYQRHGKHRNEVRANYVLDGDGRHLGFAVAEYDKSRALVIDPALEYSTYLGGTGNSGVTGIAVDATGATYLTGWTESLDLAGSPGSKLGSGGSIDAFIAKLNAAGDSLVYLAYLGGTGDDRSFGIAIDSAGCPVVTGRTYSRNFPLSSAVQSTLAGGSDAFVTKLNATGGGVLMSTYLGGGGADTGAAVALDSGNNIFVTGTTASTNFPVMNAFQSKHGGLQDAFLAKIGSNGGLRYSTYLGSLGDDSANAIAVDTSGNAYITGGTDSTLFPTVSPLQEHNGGGQDAFVAKFSGNQGSLAYSTYIGGSGGTVGFPESGTGITVDSQGNAFVAGNTSSLNFPTLNPFQKELAGTIGAFILKMDAAGGSLKYSTYLGGHGPTYATGIAADKMGKAYVAGYTAAGDFPTLSPLQSVNAGIYDAFVIGFHPSGNALIGGTYLGGLGSDAANAIAVDANYGIYIAGETQSTAFPTTRGALQVYRPGAASGFFAKLPAWVTVSAATNLASGKAATQTGGAGYAPAGYAVDNNTNGNFALGSVTHSLSAANAWWQVDLGASAVVNSIAIWNRTDSCGDRLSDYWVFVSDTPFGAFETPATLKSRAGTWSNHQTTAPNPSTTISVGGAHGRYVRVQLAGTNYLSLAEVQVFGDWATQTATNLAAGRTAAQSGGAGFAPANYAVDSNTNGQFGSGSVTHTTLAANAWWQVDLGASATLNSVVIWNRTDSCQDRLNDYWVFISTSPFSANDTPATLQSRAGTWSSHQTTVPNPAATILTGGVSGRYVRVQLSGTNYLSLAEVQVFGAPLTQPEISLAAGKSATQSGGAGYAAASLAVDNNTDGQFGSGSVTHTPLAANAWWQVDLGASATINSVVIWNRTDGCEDRLSDYWVFSSNSPFGASDTPATLMNRAGTWSSHQTTIPNPSTTIRTGGVSGRYVRVQLSGSNYLSLAEVQVFGPVQ